MIIQQIVNAERNLPTISISHNKTWHAAF